MAYKRAAYSCDLHTHTNHSDGRKTPKEVIDEAAELGLKVLAITDHDVIPPEFIDTEDGLVSVTEYARKKGIICIPGIEISCDTENEDVHLVCLGCDWKHPFFRQMEKEIQGSKLESYRTMLENFKRAGYHAEWDDMLCQTGNIRHPERIQKKQIFQYLADSGAASEWSQVKKMVQTNSELSVKRRKPDTVDIIKKIHETGGVVILAHPYLIAEPVNWQGKPITRKAYIDELIDAGLDGIEVRYTYDKTSYRGCRSKDEIAEEVRLLYGDRVAILSGGSDCHGETKEQVANPRSLGEEGITFSYMQSNQLLRNFL